MNILLISHFFPPDRIGGAEKIALVYAASLQARGHAVQVLCAARWDDGPQYWNGYSDEIYQGIAVRKINFNWTKASDPNRYLYDNPVVEANLDEWLEEWRPDVVHIVSLATLSASVVRAAKRHGIPVVFTLVDYWLVCPGVSLLRGDRSLCDGRSSDRDCLRCMLSNSNYFRTSERILPGALAANLFQWASHRSRINKLRGLRGMALNISERRQTLREICRQVDRIITPCRFLQNLIENTGLLSEPTTLIPYGHDLAWVTNMPEKKPTETVRIGFIGQIIWLKGLHVLIPAFQKLSSRYNAQLLIYGDPQRSPEYTAQLLGMIGANKAIRLMGPYAHDQIGEVLSGLDVVVVPSQWHENNPLVVQEAFASKTPVIGSNVGGISEFIRHGVNGLVFEYNSVADLQTQIERVLTEPGLIEQLRSGIGPVKTIAQEMDEIVQIYSELVPIGCRNYFRQSNQDGPRWLTRT